MWMLALQAMLYATEGINSDDDFNKAMVGVASVWCVVLHFTPRVYSYAHVRSIGTKATRTFPYLTVLVNLF